MSGGDLEEYKFTTEGLTSALLRLLGLQESEKARTGWMFLYSVLAVGGLVITGSVVGRSLFLSALPKAAVPLKFILPPVVTVLVAARYSKLATRHRTDKLILGSTIIAALTLLGFRIGLASPMGGHLVFLCALFVFIDLAVSIGMLQFWTLAGELFDPREAKRVFTIIAAGGTLASIIFGNILHQLSDLVASRDLIFLIIGCLCGMAYIVRRLGVSQSRRLEQIAPQDNRDSSPSSLWESFQGLRQDPLLLSISVLVVVVAQVSCVVDYQFDLAIQAKFGTDSQAMVGFLGNLRFFTGIAAAVVQLFLASRLLARFGLKAALLLLPIGMGVGSVGVLLSGGLLWFVLVPRAIDLILKYTINQTAFNLLYLPVNPTRQRQAKVLIAGILNPLMVSVLGVAFYVVEHYLSLPLVDWSAVAIMLILLWLYTAIRATQHYIQNLQTNIRRRTMKTDWDTSALLDNRSADVLVKSLDSEDHRAVIHTLELMGELRKLNWSEQMPTLFEHSHEEVRKRAVLLAAELGMTEHRALIEKRLNDECVGVRGAATRALCTLLKEDCVELVLPLLDSEELVIRGAAVSGLIRDGGLDGILYAAEPLKAILQSELPNERREGARILGDLEAKSFHRPLLDLMRDPHTGVRQAAVKAAGKLGHSKLVPPLIKKLEDPPVRGEATRALSRCLGQNAALLTEKLLDPTTKGEVKLATLRIFEKQRTSLAAKHLWDFLPQAQGDARTAAAQALVRLRNKGVKVPRGDAVVLKLVSEEVANGLELCRLMPEELTDNLVDLALTRRFRKICVRLLALLALLHPEISLGCIKASLYQNNDRMRAYGLELLDNVLTGSLKAQVFPFFANEISDLRETSFEDYTSDPPSRVRQLQTLARSDDWWLRCSAMYELATTGDSNDVPCVLPGLQAERTMERDTAWWALKKLSDDSIFQHHLEQHQEMLNGTNFLESLDPSKGETNVALSDLEELLFLRTVPLFTELSPEDLRDIVPIIEEVHFQAGDHLIKQGEEGDCLFVIVEGEVQVKVDGEEAKICSNPETLGELSILAEKPRSADCIAQTEVVALRLHKSDFWMLLDERPEIAKGVIRTLLKYAV